MKTANDVARAKKSIDARTDRSRAMSVTVGAWIDNDNARNEREIASALDLARHNPNVTRLVLGSKTRLDL
jgi:hypothetical protein